MPYTGSEKSTAIGLRYVWVAERDTDGTIKVPSTQDVDTAYAGINLTGSVGLTVTIPDPNRVPANGDDRVYHTFQLAPTESPTGELRLTKTHLDAIALLTGVNVFGSPPFKKVGVATDQQGLEPGVVIWGSRQAIDSDASSEYYGTQIWQTYIFLNAIATPKPAPMEFQAVSEFTFSVVANDATVDECGTAFALGTHGFTKTAYLVVHSLGKFGLDAFVGDDSELTFELSQTPTATATIVVAVNGTVQNTGWSHANGVITFEAAPAAAAKIIVEYEW